MPMYRVRTVFTGVAGTPWYSNLYFAEEGGTAAQARNAVETIWLNLMAITRDDVVYNIETDVSVIDEVTGDTIRVDNGGAVKTGAGSSTEDPLPPMTQALVRLRTGAYVGGREVRGRVFVPGLTEVASDLGVPTVAARNELQTRFSNVIALPDSIWVVWAKSRGVYAVVNATSVWNQWSVLRSRRD